MEFSWLLASILAFVPNEAPGTPSIIGGQDAAACEFPAAPAVTLDDGLLVCTAVLVHPRVLMLAGHCVDSTNPVTRAVFGERANSPEYALEIERCEVHPEYNYSPEEFFVEWDLAYCTLAEDAPDVPIVPPLMGCETEQLQPGTPIILSGFGFDSQSGGGGTKRWTTNTIERVEPEQNDLYILGDEGSSACFGDSGGPAYVQLADGTWRVAGLTSQAHPDVMNQDELCGYGAIYELVHLEMEWFETSTGYDLSPCFGSDGAWEPDERCGGFPTSLTEPGLDWSSACAGVEGSGPSATCGAPFEDEGASTSEGDPTEGTSSSGTTGGEPNPSTTLGDTMAGDTMAGDTNGADPSTGGSTTAPVDWGTGITVGTSAESTAGAEDDGADGCACQYGRSRPGAAWTLLGLIALMRRRSSVGRPERP